MTVPEINPHTFLQIPSNSLFIDYLIIPSNNGSASIKLYCITSQKS
jgi:hypothetical protein